MVTVDTKVTGQKGEDFNPHHPQGGDKGGNKVKMPQMISIHTTRKVVTGMNRVIVLFLIFQSTPPARW